MKLLALACMAFATVGAAGQTTAPSTSQPPSIPEEKTKVAPDPFAQALAARSVADFARRERDPVAMIIAARMLREIPFSDPEESAAGFTPAGLFAEAKVLARGDAMLLTQISVAQATASRGVSESAFGKGLVRSVQTVNPRSGYQFTVQAKGGEPLRVGAIGDIGTALLMRIQDGAGRTVCLDDNGDYGPVCQLTPKSAGKYRIDIVNKSGVKSRAVILSN